MKNMDLRAKSLDYDTKLSGSDRVRVWIWRTVHDRASVSYILIIQCRMVNCIRK